MAHILLEAPSDLSIGRVRVANKTGLVTEWIATQDNRAFSDAHVDCGYYVAEISPIGKPPQSVVFEIRAGQRNNIKLPPFTALAAAGSDLNFLNVGDRRAAIAALFGEQKSVIARVNPLDPSEATRAPDLPVTTDARRISVGLSLEHGGRDAFSRFNGRTSLSLSGPGLAVDVHAADDWSPWSGERVRLSVAIENTRVERLLFPMYRGGTTVNVVPSRFTAGDVELDVKPVDPNIRALLNTLGGGTPDEAHALAYRLNKVTGLPPGGAPGEVDPWEIMLWGLLFHRFADVFGPFPVMMVGWLASNMDWAYDAHVIEARRVLSAATDEPEALSLAINSALRSLAHAQVAGSPYFAYTNQLFNEMLQSMNYYDGIDSTQRPKLDRIVKRARREYALQRSAGFSFSWLSRDPELLKQGVLAPNRRSSGLLRARDTRILFTGSVEYGRIRFDTVSGSATNTSREGPVPLPQVEVEIIPTDPVLPAESALFPGAEAKDPHVGKFGGKSVAGGFSLTAEFAPSAERNWVTIKLRVESETEGAVVLGDTARFYLHPTFSPDEINVMFRGRRAILTVKACGGFVVGVRLQRQKIALECDLARLPDAPKIIRER